MANQGRLLSGPDISRIVDLLSTTDISMSDIAVRMGCSRSAVATINRKCCIRYYNGRRSVWATSESKPDTPPITPAKPNTRPESIRIRH